MKIRITDRCVGHTMCVLACDLIEIDDQMGNAYVADPQVPPDKEDDARLAADACPESAIEIVEED